MRIASFRLGIALCVLMLPLGCGENTGSPRGLAGTDGAGGVAGTDGTAGTAGSAGSTGVIFTDGSTPPETCDGSGGVCVLPDEGVEIPDGDGGTTICHFVQCENRVTACGDCSDNDGDGLIDVLDPECLGPCDNYEGPELLAGIGGEGAEQCKADCYFDFGNGAGNDDCRWSRSCDPLEPKAQCTYDEDKLGGRDCPLPNQSDRCNDFCAPLTPNGCDCFGCCTFPELDGSYVYIGSEEGCTFDTVTDPNRCKACTPAASCLNTCEECEICLGKPTIPAECLPGTGGSGGGGGTAGTGGSTSPPGERCPEGVQVCGLPGDAPCTPGEYCVTGCCRGIVVQ